jgi:hypothetical protein
MFARLIAYLIGNLSLATMVAAQPVGDPIAPRPGYLLVTGTPTDTGAMGRYARNLPHLRQARRRRPRARRHRSWHHRTRGFIQVAVVGAREVCALGARMNSRVAPNTAAASKSAAARGAGECTLLAIDGAAQP